MAKLSKANKAWLQIFEDYNVLEKIKKDGFFEITADEVKRYREPRLMVKWDCRSEVPSQLRNYGLNVIPNSRGSYVVGDFELFEDFPKIDNDENKVKHIEIPKLETIDVENITNEATAIHTLIISGALQDFLETDVLNFTFGGRMGTGKFDFFIDGISGGTHNIEVNKAQCEIDAGLENDDNVVIIEAKNVVHPDFNVRQLYYPYRYWRAQVKKPVRLVYSVYKNKTFNLYEYIFKDINNYSSISCIRKGVYTLDSTVITQTDLEKVIYETDEVYTDLYIDKVAPFPQADSMDRICFIMEILYEKPRTKLEVLDMNNVVDRQYGYYKNAGIYLGLFTVEGTGDNQIIDLTSLGRRVYELGYRERHLGLVKQIVEHTIFNKLFKRVLTTHTLPSKEEILQLSEELEVYEYGTSYKTKDRRAETVRCWIKWSFDLVEDWFWDEL